MGKDKDVLKMWGTADAGTVAWLATCRIEPEAYRATSSTTTALYDRTEALDEAVAAYRRAQCCCRRHVEAYQTVLRFLQDKRGVHRATVEWADDDRETRKETSDAGARQRSRTG